MGLLQEIRDAYNGGRNVARILDKITAEEIMQKKPWSKEDLILLVSEVESYLTQEEKRGHYGLLQKVAYNLAFKLSPQINQS